MLDRIVTSSGYSLRSGHPTSSERALRTSYTSSGLMVTHGTPGFMMPAFSDAIFSIVSPRNAVCSRPMLLMTVTSGMMTLVESRRPPIPTSMTTISAETSLKNRIAVAVRTSKLVHCIPSARIASATERTSPRTCSRSASSISEPHILMHSFMRRISGDVNAPTLTPDASSMDSIMEQTEPFPSVPATCMKRMESWGLPSLSRSSDSFPRPGLIPLEESPPYHRMFDSDAMISPGWITARLIWVTPWLRMRGTFVSNAFLRGGKFEEPAQMFSRAASDAGIGLECVTNLDLTVPIGDANAVRGVIGDADFILFWDKDVRCASNMELCGFPVFNGSDCIATCDDKSATHIALEKHCIPSIETITCPLSFSEYSDLSFLDRAIGLLGLPMVVKDCYGSFGQQVHLARTREELASLLGGPFVPRILQKYIECNGTDIRVEVVGGRAVAAMRRAAPEGDFRSNATIGGTIAACEPAEDVEELAIRACEAVGADFAGVDIIVTDDCPVVCEVNSNAHLRNLLDCTGIDVSPMILDHVARAVRG